MEYGGGQMEKRTFTTPWFLDSWWKCAVAGVTVYGGLVLIGYYWPKSWQRGGGQTARRKAQGGPRPKAGLQSSSGANSSKAIASGGGAARGANDSSSSSVVNAVAASSGNTDSQSAGSMELDVAPPGDDELDMGGMGGGGPGGAVSEEAIAAEFERALGAAREFTKQGNYAAADAMYAQLLITLERFEGPSVQSVYLLLERMPLLGVLGRHQEVCKLSEYALEILNSSAEMARDEQEGIGNLKKIIYHQYARALVTLGRFALAVGVVDRAVEFCTDDELTQAMFLLLKAEILEKQSETEHRIANPAAFERGMQDALNILQTCRKLLDRIADEAMKKKIFYKPELQMVSILLTWGKMEEAIRVQERLVDSMVNSGQISQGDIASQMDEYADIVLDHGQIERAEKIFKDALLIWERLARDSLENKRAMLNVKAGVASKIWFQQDETKVKMAELVLDEARRFTEDNKLPPFRLENIEIRVEAIGLKYVGAHPAGGVAATLSLTVRCKRKIEDKRPRLPFGSTLSFRVVEWDARDVALAGKLESPESSSSSTETTFSAPLSDDHLNSEDRSKRVVKFEVSGMCPRATPYLVLISVIHNGEVISLLRQHLPSYVDCPSVTLDQAWEKEAEIRGEGPEE